MERYTTIVSQRKVVREMIDAVLLDGFLDKPKLEQALKELRSISFGNAMPTIVIKSNGGDAVATAEFIRMARPPELRIYPEIKIYEASSAAALIALSLESREIEMRAGTEIKIHRGELTLSPSQVDEKGKINQGLLKSFKEYDTILVEALRKFELDKDAECMSILYATDWLVLTASYCLSSGIVKRLF